MNKKPWLTPKALESFKGQPEINGPLNYNDPIFENKGKWYFWDETWANSHGPYKSYEKARSELNRYIREVLGDD